MWLYIFYVVNILWMYAIVPAKCLPPGICVFGSKPSCFYQCLCQFANCNVLTDPECQICDELTGVCFDIEACKYDTLLREIYYNPYWSGIGCQYGNIAQGKFYDVKGTFVNQDRSLGPANDGTMNWYVAFYVTPFQHTATIYLEKTHKVEFADVFLVSEDLTIAQLARYITMKLVREDGSSSECHYVSNPPYEHRLKINLNGKERMHLTCDSPSIGYKMEVVMVGEGFTSYEVHVHEIVIVGHRYADVDDDKCIELQEDSDIRLCSKCNNTLPPECKEACPEGFHGINCDMAIPTTIETTPTTEETTTEPADTTTKSTTTGTTSEKETGSTTTLDSVPNTPSTSLPTSNIPTSGAPTTSTATEGNPDRIEQSATTENNPVIFMTIGIVVGLLICICVVLGLLLVFYKRSQSKRKKKERSKDNKRENPSYIEDETYDELNTAAMEDRKSGHISLEDKQGIMTNRRSIPNEYLAIIGVDRPRISLPDGYLTTKDAEGGKTLEQSPPFALNRENIMAPDAKMDQPDTKKQSNYLTPRDLGNPMLESLPNHQKSVANEYIRQEGFEGTRKSSNDDYLTAMDTKREKMMSVSQEVADTLLSSDKLDRVEHDSHGNTEIDGISPQDVKPQNPEEMNQDGSQLSTRKANECTRQEGVEGPHTCLNDDYLTAKDTKRDNILSGSQEVTDNISSTERPDKSKEDTRGNPTYDLSLEDVRLQNSPELNPYDYNLKSEQRREQPTSGPGDGSANQEDSYMKAVQRETIASVGKE